MMNKFGRNQYTLAFAFLVILSLACSSQITVFETSSPPKAETLVAGTLTAFTENAPTATIVRLPTENSVAASPTLEQFGEVYVFTTADNVNLRIQPGTLFQVSRVMPNNTKLRLLGQAPGGEWLSVRNDEGIAGWVNVNVVLMAYDGPPPPVIEPNGVYLVTGSLMTESGTPVSGAGFAIIQSERRTDATTDENGHFYAYLPLTFSGTWQVNYVSITCNSNVMDENCKCIDNICGTAEPLNSAVVLPQNGMLTFIWR